ncbi:N-acetyl-gamma-glutamyl-phosphate reductase [Clostridium oceanicum]|uniref:N-acetyl-gamma-glutamyl-phosphate reductase n=1 Tax=Clostridium oceanicum TaxID=1543 RepID=A0ABP3UTQ6_9CLOT
MKKIGIVGSTGYAGQQLVFLLNNHKDVIIDFLVSNSYAYKNYNEVYKSYNNILDQKCIDMKKAKNKLDDVDLIFTAMPHSKSLDLVKKAVDKGVKVIDIGSDYRLKEKELYKIWYGFEHRYPQLLEKSVYSIPELVLKDKIRKTSIIANPGCYPTATLLSLVPLLKEKIIDFKSIIVDAKSGVTGAGRKTSLNSLFCECNESMKAYSITNHRHTPEIEQFLSDATKEDINISFNPHLIPINRGILVTCYGKLSSNFSEDYIRNIYKSTYENCKFIRILDDLPEIKWVKNSNFCDIGFKVDKRTGNIIIVACIDNLMKGAAGQAVQNMNIIFDFNESEGLSYIPSFP